MKHIRMPHCTVQYSSDVVDDLVWVRRIYGPLLLNKNLLVRRDRTRMGISYVVRNGRRWVQDRMSYPNEPSHVPPKMSPRLTIRNQISHLLQAEDMQSKLHESLSHILCRKTQNVCRRSGPCLDIPVLPKNPLWQVTDPHVFVDHDPSRVPAYVLKGRNVSSSLIRPPDDMRMLQQINDISVVSRISKASGKFSLTHKRGNSRVVIFIRNPRKEVPEVCKNPSLQNTMKQICIITNIIQTTIHLRSNK